MTSDESRPALLMISGLVHEPQLLTARRIFELPAGQVPDVSVLESKRQGHAIELQALLALAKVKDEATQLLIKSQDGFSTKVSLELVADRAVVIYGAESKSLDPSWGGPFRFLIPNAAACGEAELDTCANVKQVISIEVS